MHVVQSAIICFYPKSRGLRIPFRNGVPSQRSSWKKRASQMAWRPRSREGIRHRRQGDQARGGGAIGPDSALAVLELGQPVQSERPENQESRNGGTPEQRSSIMLVQLG